MELASPVQAQGLPSNARESYATRAKREKIPRSTLWHRDHGRPSREAKGQNQQYLTPPEEKALVQYLLRMAALGTPVRVKYLPSLAFSIARWRPATNALKRATKPPCKNWP